METKIFSDLLFLTLLNLLASLKILLPIIKKLVPSSLCSNSEIWAVIIQRSLLRLPFLSLLSEDLVPDSFLGLQSEPLANLWEYLQGCADDAGIPYETVLMQPSTQGPTLIEHERIMDWSLPSADIVSLSCQASSDARISMPPSPREEIPSAMSVFRYLTSKEYGYPLV